MNPPKYFPVLHRPVQTSGMVIQVARKQLTKSRPDKFDTEIVSLIVQQLHAGAISFLTLAPIWLILLNPVTYVTGSAKTRHNRANINLQYKALNTMGEILQYY